MTSKCLTNTLKLAVVYACGRKTVELMSENLDNEKEQLIDFKVSSQDMLAAYEFVKMSLNTYKILKVFIKVIN